APGEDRTPLAPRPRGPGPAASWRGRWSLPVPAGAGRAGGGGVPWRCAVPKRGGRLGSGTGSGNTRVPGGRGRGAPGARTRAGRRWRGAVALRGPEAGWKAGVRHRLGEHPGPRRTGTGGAGVPYKGGPVRAAAGTRAARPHPLEVPVNSADGWGDDVYQPDAS